MSQAAKNLDVPAVSTDKETQTARKRIIRGKTALTMDPEFSLFSGVLMSLDVVITDDVPTAGTNGLSMYFNAHYISTLSDACVRLLLMHECLHVALEHTMPSRQLDRDPMLFNIACDVVINYLLTAQNTFSKEQITDDMGGIFDLGLYREGDGNADKIYRLLQQEQQQQQQQPSKPGRVQGEPFDDITIDPIDPEHEFEAKVLVKEALLRVRKSENFGKLHGDMQRLINDLDINKPTWTQVLDNYLASDRVTRDWSRPANRFAAQGIYLPSRGGRSLDTVVVSLDVSGSINQDELDRRSAEIYSIVEDYRPKKLVVLSHDRDAHLVDECDQGEDPDMTKVKGGGGTSFRKVIPMAAKYEPDVMVMLTDLCGDFPEAPDFPVIWASTYRDHAPFGDVILIDG
tara:strand:+ start:1857 stop:3059 length:1203 start_codon:yes stop_codon:yes gene_type:complete